MRLIPALPALLVAWGAFAVAAVAVPTAPPPDAGSPAPPPAFVQTPAGDRWLGYSTYCWTAAGSGGRGLCADYVSPAMRGDLPRIVVRRGRVVRFHLGFMPRTLTLTVGERTYRLRPRESAAWRVRGAGGVLVLTATARQGDAAFVARLDVRLAPQRSA